MLEGYIEMAPTGTTGNNTHSAVVPNRGYEGLAFQFEIEAVGATPTVTFKVQGSLDGTNYYDLGYITDASDTIATAALTKTSVAAYIIFLSNPLARSYKYFRLVTTANTNVTYSAKLYQL